MPPDQQSHPPRASIRMDARLDAATRATLEDLIAHVHRSRTAVLRQVMQWGLSRPQMGTVDAGDAPGPVTHLFVTVAPELHEQMRRPAATAGFSSAAWLRHLLRQITRADFPESWQRGARYVPTIDLAGKPQALA